MQQTKAEDLQSQIDTLKVEISDMQKIVLELANRLYVMREIFDEYKAVEQK